MYVHDFVFFCPYFSLLHLGALKPIGHCCYDICGAVIHIEKPTTYEAPFDLKEVKRIIEITLKPLEKVPTTHFEPDFIRKGTSHHFLLINLCTTSKLVLFHLCKEYHPRTKKMTSNMWSMICGVLAKILIKL